ncbi:RNA-directed DNA polymerase, eukaryota, reverse transcriptase zinc-binding domain protein [Tanacetum coccineum]
MLERKENKPNKADENIAKFEVASKSKSSTFKPEKATAHKVVTQKVQTIPFPAKSPVPIKNCILGLEAAHTWVCIDSKLDSKKSVMDNSFTLGSNEEADNVKILQSCNGLLLYVVNTAKFMTPLPERWLIWSTIWSTGLGEREEDSFLVIDLAGKVVKYNLISKTISQIFDTGSNQMVDDYEFFLPYTNYSIRRMVDSVNYLEYGLGERKKDSFLIINLSGKVVKYNLISKTINEIFDIRSNQMDDDDDFIPPLSVDTNLYEFTLSLTSVVNSDNLIHSLSNIWIRKLRLHANVAMFGRKVDVKPSYAGVKVNTPVVNRDRYHPASNNSASYVNVAKANDDCGDHIPVVELKQHTLNDFPLAILGCYMDFRSIANACSLCLSEGFLNVSFNYLGGLWLLFEFKSLKARNEFLKHDGILSWFSSLKPWHDDFIVEERLIWLEIEGIPIRAWEYETFKSICNKWGEVIFSDDTDSCNRLSKRLCIKLNHNQLIFATSFMSLMNVTYAIRVREQLDTYRCGEDNGDAHTKDDDVHDSYQDEGDNVIGSNQQHSHQDALDSDPFGLEPLINKKFGKEDAPQNSTTPEFPPGFSPSPITEKLVNQPEVQNFVQPPGCENTLAALIANNGEVTETKMVNVDMWMLRQVWGNIHFDFASMSSRGMSGGIICLWNNLVFRKTSIICNENYMVVEGIWIPNDVRIMWIAVYTPQSLHDKIALWEADERFGLNFNERHAEIFNAFILNSFLIDVPLGGYKFTWTDKWGSKMSKLDILLVSESFYDTFPHTTGVVLEKGIPDHHLILLKEHSVDYGPIPFRFFHSWLELDGFHNLIEDTWKNDGIVKDNGLVSFKKKLQNLKRVIRDWITTKKYESSKLKKEHLIRLSSIDVKIDQGTANDLDFLNRRDSTRILGDIDLLEASDLAQKARIKWAMEGDETLAFFMPCLRKTVDSLPLKCFSGTGLSRHEIKKVVWDCGGDHAPGPDGFTFKFFTSFWDLLEADVTRFVHAFFLNRSFHKGCNSSFIALIPKVSNATLVTDFRPISLIRCQYKIIGKILANRLGLVIGSCICPKQSAFIKGRNILDGPLILNEVMNWYRQRRVLGLGLRQVDPLSPFLFILAMEGLHALVCKAVNMGIYKGATIGYDHTRVSHLIYADDVIFAGHWSVTNVHNLLCILRCFFFVSGLKINVQKCILLGVCVSEVDVLGMANIIGCGAANLPLTYLGISVGGSMSRCHNWEAIVKKNSSNLSLWKARLLSVGGRISLIKSILGNLPTYFMLLYLMPASIRSKLESLRNNFFNGSELGERKMVWVSWKTCLASKESGGLGIGSIYALNVGLLFKWIWRFLHNHSDLWKLRNGESAQFWDDIWCGNQALKSKFPRIYMLDNDKGCNVAKRLSMHDWSTSLRRNPRGGVEASQFTELRLLIDFVELNSHQDSWSWSLDVHKGFTVASVRSLIDSHFLVAGPNATRWNRNIPIKVNVFLWRVMLNKLPTMVNLDRRDLWALLARWWELDVPFCANISEWFSWLDSLYISNKAWLFLDGVGGTLMWSIWSFRNRLVFSNSPPKKSLLWDNIISYSYLWISSRNPKFKLSWVLLHHYGRFTSPPGRKFVDGIVATVDPVELSNFSSNQMKAILTKCLGYDENSATFLYIKKSNRSLDSGLVLFDDAIQDIDSIVSYTQTYQKLLHVYVSRVELSPLVVADQLEDGGKRKKKTDKPSCSKKLFD